MARDLKSWPVRILHGVLIVLEIGVLIAIVGVSICNCLPLADRCYESMPSVLRYRLAKGQDTLVGKITQCRIYCSTKQFEDMRKNPSVVVALDKLKSCEEVEVPLPTGLLNFRIDFYYHRSSLLPEQPPALETITLNGKGLCEDWLHECRLEAIKAIGWSYVKKPCLQGRLTELIFCAGLIYVLPIIAFILILRRRRVSCANEWHSRI